MKQLISVLLAVTMMISCFANVSVSAADKAECIVLDCNLRGSITKANMTVDRNDKADGDKYAAVWKCSDFSTYILDAPNDISEYTELRFWVNPSEKCTVYIMFSSNNSATDGSDYYGDKFEFKQGWQEISIELGKMTVSRTPRGYHDIDDIGIHTTGWSMENSEKLEIKFGTIKFVANPEYTDLKKAAEESRKKAEAAAKAEAERIANANKTVGSKIFYNCNFDSATSASSASLDGAVPAAKTNEISLVEKDGGKHLSFVIKEETDDCFIDIKFKSDSIYLIWEVSVSYDGILKGGNFQYKDISWNGGSLMGFDATGSLNVGGVNVGKIEKDKWTNIKMAMNLLDKKCDVYINDKKTAEQIAFAGTQDPSMAMFRMYLGKGGAGSGILLDNVKIYEGDKPRDIGEAKPEGYVKGDNSFEEAKALFSSAPVYNAPVIDKADVLLKGKMGLVIGNSKAYANGELKAIDFDNEQVAPVIVNSRTLVPIRFISENLGAEVSWDGEARKVVISGGKNIEMYIDKPEIYIDTVAVTLDVAPMILNDRTMLPLRAVSEALDKNVFWDNRGLIIISDKDVVIDQVKDSACVDTMLSMIKYGITTTNYNQSPKFTQSIIDEAIDTPTVIFTSGRTSSNVGWDAISQKATTATYYLTLIVNRCGDVFHSKSGKSAKERVLEQLRAVIKGKNEPMACSGPYVSHSVLSSAITLAKMTPEIWNEFSPEEVEKFDWLMRALAIAGNWSYNDENDYHTGFDLTGNFAKGWNPNYKNTYVPVVGNASIYFGGADNLNKIFAEFDYDTYIAKLKSFNFTNITDAWEIAGKDLMENGGDAFLSEEWGGAKAGTGKGVKIPFKYGGYGLDELGKLAGVHILATYRAVVCSKVSLNGAEAGIAKGIKSPYEGYRGMMFEFVSSDAGGLRSSASYCHASQITLFPYLANLNLAGIWDAENDEEQRYLNNLMYVGNEDVVFKLENGYNSYVKGSYTGTEYDSNYTAVGYSMDKDIWRKFFCFAGEDTKIKVFSLRDEMNITDAEPMSGTDGKAPEGAVLPAEFNGGVCPDAYFDIGKHTGNFTVEFDLVYGDDVTDDFDSCIAFVPEIKEKIAYSEMHAILQSKKLTLNVMNGKGYVTGDKVFSSANYRYHIKIDFDVTKNTYSVYATPIHPTVGDVICIAENYSFRSSAGKTDSIGYMLLVNASPAEGMLWLENLLIK